MVKFETKDGTTSMKEETVVKCVLKTAQDAIGCTRDQINNIIETLDSILFREDIIEKLQMAEAMLKDVQSEVHNIKESVKIPG